MTPVLADTGFLVALFDPADALAAPAANYLKAHRHRLVATTATVVEACFFLTPRAKADLLAWIRRGGMAVLDVPAAAYAQLGKDFEIFRLKGGKRFEVIDWF